MNRKQEWLQRAATALGIRAHVTHSVKLLDGRTLVADAYFPDLSNRSGVLVFDWANEPDAEARRQLDEMGIGVSTFAAPGPNEQFDLKGYEELFSDWGWTGPNDGRPPWMAQVDD